MILGRQQFLAMQAIVLVPGIISITMCSKQYSWHVNRIHADTLHDAYLHTTRDLDSKLEAALAPFAQPSSNTTSTKVKAIAITILLHTGPGTAALR